MLGGAAGRRRDGGLILPERATVLDQPRGQAAAELVREVVDQEHAMGRRVVVVVAGALLPGHQRHRAVGPAQRCKAGSRPIGLLIAPPGVLALVGGVNQRLGVGRGGVGPVEGPLLAGAQVVQPRGVPGEQTRHLVGAPQLDDARRVLGDGAAHPLVVGIDGVIIPGQGHVGRAIVPAAQLAGQQRPRTVPPAPAVAGRAIVARDQLLLALVPDAAVAIVDGGAGGVELVEQVS